MLIKDVVLNPEEPTESHLAAALALSAAKPVELLAPHDRSGTTRFYMPDGSIQELHRHDGPRVVRHATIDSLASAIEALPQDASSVLLIGVNEIRYYRSLGNPRDYHSCALSMSDEYAILRSGVPVSGDQAAPPIHDRGWAVRFTPDALERYLRTHLRLAMSEQDRDALAHGIKSLSRTVASREATQAGRDTESVDESGSLAMEHNLDVETHSLAVRLYAQPELRDRSPLNVLINPAKKARELCWEITVTSEDAGEFRHAQLRLLAERFQSRDEWPERIPVFFADEGPASLND